MISLDNCDMNPEYFRPPRPEPPLAQPGPAEREDPAGRRDAHETLIDGPDAARPPEVPRVPSLVPSCRSRSRYTVQYKDTQKGNDSEVFYLEPGEGTTEPVDKRRRITKLVTTELVTITTKRVEIASDDDPPRPS